MGLYTNRQKIRLIFSSSSLGFWEKLALSTLEDMFVVIALRYLWSHYYTFDFDMCLALSQTSAIFNHKEPLLLGI